MQNDISTTIGKLFMLASLVAIGALGYSYFYHYGEVLEVKCVVNTGLTDNRKCNEVAGTGSVLQVTLNEVAQKVLLTVVKSDGNWFGDQIFYEKCNIINRSNWVCEEEADYILSDPIVRTIGMKNGRYYSALTNNSPPSYYTSSISGLAHILYDNSLIELKTAIDFPI